MTCTGLLEPEKLPPTKRAAHFHGLRVHFQIIEWKLLSDDEDCKLNPEDWGWKVQDEIFTQ